MNIEVKIPAVGESITSGVLSIWHKKEGDSVSRDELLFTLETDKVSQEVMAADSGVLHIKVAEGQEVKIGQVVAEIAPGQAAAPSKAAASEPAKPAVVEKAVAVAPVPAPVAVVKPAPVLSASGDESRTVRKKLSPLRRKIATQLVMAQQTAAILTTFNECDMTAVMALRKELQEEFTKKHGVKLGFMSFFIKAVVDALQAIPSINSRIDGEDLVTSTVYDIGVAVGTERGLIVPVVRDCDRLSFADIESRLAGYATKAREGKISLDDLKGGVFTISNGGTYGSLLSTPILNPPQSGILGMHKIQERPVVIKGQIVARPMMYLALSYDHRVVDGKEAVTFLVRVKDCIENPARLLLGA
ncbi:dihydrolipoyllysine-residue succinyltransferase [bacterium]|nr:dihydrolipoyllysine-residue succinyltransferase [bacterium]NBS53109.1 dihydrolipoyllysine-residue succinyltransferase [Spartobacteria bacterium]